MAHSGDIFAAIESLRSDSKEQLISRKKEFLELFNDEALLDEALQEAEDRLSDLEQEYWDDQAVYAGRNVKDSDEYDYFDILSKLSKAKDKAKFLDILIDGVKSKGKSYQPKTKAELKKLVRNRNIYLGDIDVSNIGNFVELFMDSTRRDFGGIEKWDTSNVTDMEACFYNAKHFNEDISSWNVAKCKNFKAMFYDAISFNKPLNAWNVSCARDMGGMFYGAEKFNQPLDSWDISKVENMSGMFEYAESFNQDLNAWGDKVQSNARVLQMFQSTRIAQEKNYPKWFRSQDENGIYKPRGKYFLKELISDLSVKLSDIDTSLITNMGHMFERDWAAARKDLGDIANWNVSNVTIMDSMFQYAKSFNVDLSKWDTRNVEYMGDMFKNAESFNSDISNWNVSKVEDMEEMFRDAKSFKQDLSKWNLNPDLLFNNNGTYKMFENCPTQMLEIWREKWKESLVKHNGKFQPQTKQELRYLCKFESVHLGDIDTSLITDMSQIFVGSQRKDFSGIESWDTSNVADMGSMFSEAEYFNHNINDWNVSHVKNMGYMFEEARRFNQPLDKWNVSQVENINSMFKDCNDFDQNLDSWKLNEKCLAACQNDKNTIFIGTKRSSNPPKWLAAEPSVKEICDLLEKMCKSSYDKDAQWFISTYDAVLTKFKTLLKKKKINDKDLAKIYGLAMGEREFYKDGTIGNCPLELLELIKENAKDFKVALKIGSLDKKLKINFLDASADVGRADIVKFLFEAGETFGDAKYLYLNWNENTTNVSNEEILKVYHEHGFDETSNMPIKYYEVYFCALENSIFAKEKLEAFWERSLMEEVIGGCGEHTSLEWFKYLVSKGLSEKERNILVQHCQRELYGQVRSGDADYIRGLQEIFDSVNHSDSKE